MVSLKKKLLFSLISVTAFFLALEGVLALVGVRPEADSHDPYVGFSSRIPLMQLSEDAAGARTLTTAPGKLVWFNEQTFAPTKPPGTRRVFCLGGSTTYGRPYGDLTSYSNWLRHLLPMVDGETNWEVINAGGVSYASYRVAAVMEELAQYEPDLFIVYSAHNEFLERRTYANMFAQSDLKIGVSSVLSSTRTWTAMRRLAGRGGAESKSPDELLPAEVDEVLNHSIGPADYQRDDAWRKKVIHHYQLNLARMVKIARDSGRRSCCSRPRRTKWIVRRSRASWPSNFPLISGKDFGCWKIAGGGLRRQIGTNRRWLNFQKPNRSMIAIQVCCIKLGSPGSH